jgi:hypothetical protein
VLKLPIGEFEYGQYETARSVSAIVRKIKPGTPVTWASDYGAYTVWMDGKEYVAEFHQSRLTVSRGVVTTKDDLRRFLKANWHYISGEPTP